MTTSHPCNENGAFTLRELLVVIVVLTVLAGLLVTTARGAATRRIKVAQCAANLRLFAQATQLYALENREWLPLSTSGAWAWDLSQQAADSLLRYGMNKRTFYCPGTSPRFNDQLNYLNLAPGSSLWTFAPGAFRVIGYAHTLFWNSLSMTNQNTTILPEPTRLSYTPLNGPTYLSSSITASSERVLFADATISENLSGTAAIPAPAGSFTTIWGGFPVPHLSPHLNGKLPAGGNLAFKDGHVAWRKFADMSQRASPTSSSRGFWW